MAVSLGVLGCIYLGPALASPKSIEKKAIETSARIEGATQGSGVIVNKSGNTYTLLTAWHVIKDNRKGEEIEIFTVDGRRHLTGIENSTRIGNLDLAVISFRSDRIYQSAKISYDKDTSGGIITVTGFPITKSGKIMVSPARIIANAEVGIDQGYQLLYEGTTTAGMSGGALANQKGELIGIHGRGELDQQKSKATGNIVKTPVSQGVPVYFYVAFESGNSLTPRSLEASTWDDYYALYNSTTFLNQYGQREAVKGQEQTQLRLANQLIRLKPKAMMSYMAKYAALEALGRHQEKQASLEQVLDKVKQFNHHSSEARKAFVDRNTDRSLDEFAKAQEYLWDIGADNYSYKAQIYLARGDLSKAIEEAKKGIYYAEKAYHKGVNASALDLTSETLLSISYSTLGEAFLRNKDFEEALESLDKSVYWASKARHDMADSIRHELIGRVFYAKAIASLFAANQASGVCDSLKVSYAYNFKEAVGNSLLLGKCKAYGYNFNGTPSPTSEMGKNSVVKALAERICEEENVWRVAEEEYRHLLSYIQNYDEIDLLAELGGADEADEYAKMAVWTSGHKCPEGYRQAVPDSYRWQYKEGRRSHLLFID